jgi:hypothetical protein
MSIFPKPSPSAARALQAILFALLGASLVAAGCTPAPPAAPVNTADPGGIGMTPQQQLEALKNNTTMPAPLKARKISILERQLGQSSADPVGRK